MLAKTAGGWNGGAATGRLDTVATWGPSDDTVPVAAVADVVAASIPVAITAVNKDFRGAVVIAEDLPDRFWPWRLDACATGRALDEHTFTGSATHLPEADYRVSFGLSSRRRGTTHQRQHHGGRGEQPREHPVENGLLPRGVEPLDEPHRKARVEAHHDEVDCHHRRADHQILRQ
jgi:hypothetical protein